MNGLRQSFSLSALVALFLCLNIGAADAQTEMTCPTITNIDPQIACWEALYPGLVAYEMTETQRANVIKKNTIGDLSAGTRAVWLHHPDHTVVWIIIADDVGAILRDGKLPLRYLPQMIGPGNQSMLKLTGSGMCRTIEHFRELIQRNHPNAEIRTMSGDLKRRFVERTGHRDSANAVIVWASRPGSPTALVATFRNGCFTSMREFPSEMIESLELGSAA